MRGEGVSGKKAPALKSVTHITEMMKLGTVIPHLKKIQKMYHVAHPFSSADISIFHGKKANFLISRNTDTDCILIQNF